MSMPPNFPTGLGREHVFEAARPLDALVDSAQGKIRLATRLADASEVYLWLTKEQFGHSLSILRLCARQLGVQWPS